MSLDNKGLLLIYHSQTGHTESLAQAIFEGIASVPNIFCRFKKASEADLSDLLWAKGVIFGTPENFGYMSGALKSFFDRTYYPAESYQLNLPYSLFVSAGNDGSGAVRAVERILKGYPMRKVSEAIIIKGEIEKIDLQQCYDLGKAMAEGMDLGIF